VIHENQSGRF